MASPTSPTSAASTADTLPSFLRTGYSSGLGGGSLVAPAAPPGPRPLWTKITQAWNTYCKPWKYTNGASDALKGKNFSVLIPRALLEISAKAGVGAAAGALLFTALKLTGIAALSFSGVGLGAIVAGGAVAGAVYALGYMIGKLTLGQKQVNPTAVVSPLLKMHLIRAVVVAVLFALVIALHAAGGPNLLLNAEVGVGGLLGLYFVAYLFRALLHTSCGAQKQDRTTSTYSRDDSLFEEDDPTAQTSNPDSFVSRLQGAYGELSLDMFDFVARFPWKEKGGVPS